MKRTNNVAYLISINGMDKSGKSTLMEWIERSNTDDFIYYHHENNLSINRMQDIYENLKRLHKENPNKYILIDDLFSYDVNDNYKDNIEDIFNGKVLYFALIWEDYPKYLERCDKINAVPIYKNNEEFHKSKHWLTEKTQGVHGKIFYINSNTLPSKIYDTFNYIMDSIF